MEELNGEAATTGYGGIDSEVEIAVWRGIVMPYGKPFHGRKEFGEVLGVGRWNSGID